jgi:hypothetical protein
MVGQSDVGQPDHHSLRLITHTTTLTGLSHPNHPCAKVQAVILPESTVGGTSNGMLTHVTQVVPTPAPRTPTCKHAHVMSDFSKVIKELSCTTQHKENLKLIKHTLMDLPNIDSKIPTPKVNCNSSKHFPG